MVLVTELQSTGREQVWRGGEVMSLNLDIVISNACHVGDWICCFEVQL